MEASRGRRAALYRRRACAGTLLPHRPDDIVGRVKTYEAIVKGQNVPKPGVPESFKVLIKELQSLGLDVKVLDKNNEEIDLKQSFDDDDDLAIVPNDDLDDILDEPHVEDEGDFDNYTIEEPSDEELDVLDKIAEPDDIALVDDAEDILDLPEVLFDDLDDGLDKE